MPALLKLMIDTLPDHALLLIDANEGENDALITYDGY